MCVITHLRVGIEQGGNSGVSQHPRRQGHGLTGVCKASMGLQDGSRQQHNAPIQARKQTSEISQAPRREGPVISGHINLSLPTIKKDITMTASAVMDSLTSSREDVYRCGTD